MNDWFIIKVPKRSLGRNFAPKRQLGNGYEYRIITPRRQGDNVKSHQLLFLN
jgi:hypothetical protein